MNNNINWEILDKKRRKILPKLKVLKKDFYLAGGAVLALQIGHRESIDFDFFTKKPFETADVFEKLRKNFEPKQIKKIQEKKNTLSFKVNGIEISCFSYQYPLLKPPIKTKYLRLASVEDIATMKLSAIVSRATIKDYIDIYYVLKEIPLKELISLTKQKYPELDTNLIIKSLAYFKDIKKEPITFRNNKEISFNEIRRSLSDTVEKYLKNS